MEKFIKNILLFTVPIIVFSFLMDILISNVVKKNNHLANGEYAVWNTILDGKVNSDIVIYGASRACAMIDPTMISDSLNISTYNIGLNGHNFWLQNLRHSLLIQNNKKPKYIIHSIDVFTLEKRKDLYTAEQFLPYMLFNTEIKDATSDYQGFSFFDYEIPLLRYYGKTSFLFQAAKSIVSHETGPENSVKGYLAFDKQWNNDFENAKKVMKYYEVKLDTPSVNLFEQYLVESKRNNIKVIFVYAPEYIEGQGFVKNRKEIVDLYSTLSKKYDIPFINYSTDSLSYDKKYFYNAQHLNKMGAELFTAKLINDLKNTKVLN